MPEVIRNHVAHDKAARRRASRQQRSDGGVVLDLLSLNRKASREVGLRCKLADLAAAGVPGAAKAKRKLNDVWTNRNQRNLDGFWNPNN